MGGNAYPSVRVQIIWRWFRHIIFRTCAWLSKTSREPNLICFRTTLNFIF